MRRFNLRTLLEIFQVIDLSLICLCYLAVEYGYAHGFGQLSLHSFLSGKMHTHEVLLLLLLGILWNFAFRMFGLYESKRLAGTAEELTDLLRALIAATVIALVLRFAFYRVQTEWAPVGIFLASSFIVMSLFRIGLRAALRVVRSNRRNLKFLVIVGTNRRAEQFAHRILKHKELGYTLAGFVDTEWRACHELRDKGYKLIADFNSVFDYIRQNPVDDVYITLPVGSFYSWITEFVNYSDALGITIRFNSDVYETKNSRAFGDSLDDLPMIAHTSGRLRGWRVALKRMMDFYLALTIILVTAPLMAICALAVKLTTPGPILFKQTRIGLNRRRFTMYKFRTMVINAEELQKELETRNEAQGPVFKIKHDPRITAVGRFLRKTSLDELPQLINVVKGDMSLVGPRPLPIRDYQGFDQDAFRRRFSVLPGITCIWQSSGRNNIPFETWMRMDLDYIDHWSFALDIRIVFKTLMGVLRCTGAA